MSLNRLFQDLLKSSTFCFSICFKDALDEIRTEIECEIADLSVVLCGNRIKNTVLEMSLGGPSGIEI